MQPITADERLCSYLAPVIWLLNGTGNVDGKGCTESNEQLSSSLSLVWFTSFLIDDNMSEDIADCLLLLHYVASKKLLKKFKNIKKSTKKSAKEPSRVSKLVQEMTSVNGLSLSASYASLTSTFFLTLSSRAQVL